MFGFVVGVKGGGKVRGFVWLLGCFVVLFLCLLHKFIILLKQLNDLGLPRDPTVPGLDGEVEGFCFQGAMTKAKIVPLLSTSSS